MLYDRKKQAIDKAIEKAFIWCGTHNHNFPGGRPGEIIEALDEETREALKTCDGNDWMHRI